MAGGGKLKSFYQNITKQYGKHSQENLKYMSNLIANTSTNEKRRNFFTMYKTNKVTPKFLQVNRIHIAFNS